LALPVGFTTYAASRQATSSSEGAPRWRRVLCGANAG